MSGKKRKTDINMYKSLFSKFDCWLCPQCIDMIYVALIVCFFLSLCQGLKHDLSFKRDSMHRVREKY